MGVRRGDKGRPARDVEPAAVNGSDDTISPWTVKRLLARIGRMPQPFDIQTFGRNVRALRRAAGHSQEGFAHLAGLDRTYVGGIERGERNPALKTIIRLAEALDVEVTSLFEPSTAQSDRAGVHRP